MKTKNTLLLILFTIILCGILEEAEAQTNGWSQPIEITLATEGGTVKAVTQSCKNGFLVFVPEQQLLWISSPLPIEHQKFVCLSNAIIRIATGGDELFIDRQTTKLQGTPEEQAEAKARIMADFEEKVKDGPSFDNIQRISIGEVLMGDWSMSPFLQPGERVRPARAASISDIRVENGIMTLPLASEHNTKVILDFDNSMNVIKGMISDNNGHQPWPMVLKAQVTLKPEALEVSPGILTAHVRLPWGYSVKNITSATCDHAAAERMMLNDDKTEMIMKFRRQDIEAALAQIGQSIDTNFVVQGVWRGAAATNFFQGTASIKKIVGAKEKQEKKEK